MMSPELVEGMKWYTNMQINTEELEKRLEELEKTKSQKGYSLPDVYSLVRDGFNIVDVERPTWWLFGRRGRGRAAARPPHWSTP